MAETPRKVVRFERYLCVGCILVVLGRGEVPKYPKYLINIYLETISKKWVTFEKHGIDESAQSTWNHKIKLELENFENIPVTEVSRRGDVDSGDF